MNLLSTLINYYRNPKYRVMKGVCINNRCLMFIGANPSKEPTKFIREQTKLHGYCDKDFVKGVIEFENQDYTYRKDNMYCRIWTFKQLMKWARLLPKGKSRVLEKTKYGWRRIDDN